ncbi:MAG: RidA family protein [Gemmatimonadales bacterium]|nr:RidA family protein [Gemmatimonadales bacterium]
MSFEIVNPESLGVPSGWNHALVAPAGGRMLFVAGQTAVGPNGRIEATSFVDQWEQALANVLIVVRTSGGTPEDIGRLTIYVTDLAAYLESRKEIGVVYRDLMGRHYPAMALVEVKRLVDDGALIEIEATAVLS